MHLFLLIWFRSIQKKIAIHFKVLPQDHFGPTLTVASNILQPEAQFGPRNTSAPIILLPDAYFSPKYFSPEILQPGNTSARNNFGPIHFGPRTKFSKVSF